METARRLEDRIALVTGAFLLCDGGHSMVGA
jgi:hypothetical protein